MDQCTYKLKFCRRFSRHYFNFCGIGYKKDVWYSILVYKHYSRRGKNFRSTRPPPKRTQRSTQTLKSRDRIGKSEASERAADKQTPYLQITAALLQLSVGEITESVCLRMLVQQVRQTPGQMRRMKVNQPTGHINLRPIFTIIGFYRLVLAALLQTVGLLTHIFFRSLLSYVGLKVHFPLLASPTGPMGRVWLLTIFDRFP